MEYIAILELSHGCVTIVGVNIQKEKIITCVRRSPLMTIATIGAGGVPETSALYVSITDDLICRGLSKTTTRKHANIKRIGQATLSCIDESHLVYIEFNCSVQFLDVLSDPEQASRILSAMEDTISDRNLSCWIPPMSQVEGSEYDFLILTPKTITYTDFSHTPDAHNAKPEKFTLTF